MQKYFETFQQMITLRGLTDHTVKSYSTYIQKERSLSDRTINSCISQLRFFTLYVLHKSWDPYQLPTRKFDAFLPFVPSKQELATFINTIPDLKVKTMVSLLYSAGLRIGEVCRLKCTDIDRKNMRIHISKGKNRSSRFAKLSPKVLPLLEEYWHSCGKPRVFLFPKQRKSRTDEPIDTFLLSRHIHEHETRLGWERRFTCHSFRHAFGTHLYEDGADLLTIYRPCHQSF